MSGRTLLAGNVMWMAWNTMLAVAPLLLACILFRGPERRRWRRPTWWIGVSAFIALLPNAPYVITDVVHLPKDTAATPSEAAELALLLEYTAFIAVGFGAYVVALSLASRFVERGGWHHRLVVVAQLAVHLLAAVGVYLGRVPGWNSWDLLTRPEAVLADMWAALHRPAVGAGVVLMFLVLTIGAATGMALLDDVAARRRRAPVAW